MVLGRSDVLGSDAFKAGFAHQKSANSGQTPWLVTQLDGARAVAVILGGTEEEAANITVNPAVIAYSEFTGWTVLHHAAARGNARLVSRLVRAGAAVDALTTSGISPLCLAANFGAVSAVEVLILAKADVNARKGNGWLPLHSAALRGHTEVVRLLLRAGADATLTAGDERHPVLSLAACVPDNTETVRLLLATKAPLDAVNNSGAGPLEAAVISNTPEIFDLLLKAGAQWQIPFGAEYHPMDAAAKRGLTGSIRKLRDLGLQSQRALSLAKDDATRALLQDDASPEGLRRRLNEEQWQVVLAEADPSLRLEKVIAHLAAGADINHLSERWGTPLVLAVYQLDLDLVRFLLARGANPAVQSKYLVGGRILPSSALHRLVGHFCSDTLRVRRAPPQFDDFLAACLPLFWPYETTPGAREEIVLWVNNYQLPKSMEWLKRQRDIPQPQP